ncbi:MAG: hypothetical protein O2955_08205 [Planctomycetota bacterium]|nr:hypothetical protein [Planctomycetota bacterium]
MSIEYPVIRCRSAKKENPLENHNTTSCRHNILKPTNIEGETGITRFNLFLSLQHSLFHDTSIRRQKNLAMFFCGNRATLKNLLLPVSLRVKQANNFSHNTYFSQALQSSKVVKGLMRDFDARFMENPFSDLP